MVRADEAPAAGENPGNQGSRRRNWAKPVAFIAGLLGALFAVAVPLLPVKVDHTTLSWPQQGSPRSITAPLVSYAPLTFDTTIPYSAMAQLGAHGGVLVSTLPDGAPDLEHYGFVARVNPAQDHQPETFQAVLRNQSLLSVPLKDLRGATFTLHAGISSATATLAGGAVPASVANPVTLTGDWRPQLVGIFSELRSPAGTTAGAQVDSRFSITPTIAKRVSTILAIVCTLIALVALYFLDARDGRRFRRLLPQRWWTFRFVDAIVLGTLVVWYFIGSTTSDDGYQFGMARASLVSGYMANYFRYWGVPETPVGTPWFDMLARMSELSTASPWVRLPTLLAGILCWLLISREILPRFGAAVRHDRVAVWTGALGFLAIWLPYDNGLRPEPIVAVCVMLTWCFVERSIATHRLLPYALAIVAAAFACTANPSGAICLAPLIAGMRSVWRFGITRARELAGAAPGTKVSRWGWTRAYGALLAPLAGAGTLVVAVAFSVIPLSDMFETDRVHQIAGPADAWYNEYLSYQWLFMPTADGSIGRRFGMVAMWLGLLVCVFVLLRKGGRIPFTAPGPTKRLLGLTFGAILLMALSPTKFTHHNGVYAGIAGCVAALTAVAVGPKVLRSLRNRALFGAVVSLILAQVFTSVNQWWWISSFGVPWNDKPPSIHHFTLYKIFLIPAVIFLALAAWWHVRAPEPGTPQRVSPRASKLMKIPPLTVAAAILVLFEVGSFAKGVVSQYPGFSLAASNVAAVTGKTCGLANDVLVEPDPNASMLKPLAGGNPFRAFANGATGFVPDGIGDLTPDGQPAGSSSIASATTLGARSSADSGTQTAGAPLPFGLDSRTTPELGTSGQGGNSDLTTGWYRLPPSSDRGGIIAVAAAGRIQSVDKDGIVTPGEPVQIEYGTTDSATTAQPLGRVTPMDIGPAPSWRNLRVPLSQVPARADVVRIVAGVHSLDPGQWVALTPPRVPVTETLNTLVGSQQPVLQDWAVGLQFSCQRPYDHKDGIAQTPLWRIMPDRGGAHDTTLWESHDGGGPLGWSDQLLRSSTLATYLKDNWREDWGELQSLTPIAPDAVPAAPTVTQDTHGGMWTPGHINTAW
ncbi:arabinosyltransferase domain-containing protein [Nocardia alni]|uniref:arabinosyltransferase domain-containing protein n=1 Tax=Nocardia alni TaxID=2815723 RepID=UPI0020B1E895